MAPGVGIKTPVPRTRTGCLTCRKRKVKCDECKPNCARCVRLQRVCVWGDVVASSFPRRDSDSSSSSSTIEIITNDNADGVPALQLIRHSGQNFVLEFPTLDKTTIPYLHHFVTFCCRFIAYPNDNDGNPFQTKLVPLASSSPALLHAMTAVSAAHLSRGEKKLKLIAGHHYSLALRALNDTLSDPDVAKSDSALGACLLLCVYEITHSGNFAWLHHLSGARDLIMYRGGPKSSDYLTRFFSLLDVSGSLSSGNAPLIEGDYWIETEEEQKKNREVGELNWPYYLSDNDVVKRYHELMTYMARLSRLSADCMNQPGLETTIDFKQKAQILHDDLFAWWNTCPPFLRDQQTSWRRQPRPQKLTVSETLEAEACSSTKSCMSGCVIYLYHILDPFGELPQSHEVTEAVTFILETAEETPEGFGLEMGLYWGLFMAGVAIFNNVVAEDLIRHKLKSDKSISIYNAGRALELLEVLWLRQHQYNRKFDWRQVQIQMGIQVFLFT